MLVEVDEKKNSQKIKDEEEANEKEMKLMFKHLVIFRLKTRGPSTDE